MKNHVWINVPEKICQLVCKNTYTMRSRESPYHPISVLPDHALSKCILEMEIPKISKNAVYGIRVVIAYSKMSRLLEIETLGINLTERPTRHDR